MLGEDWRRTHTFEKLLLELSLGDFNLDCLVDLLRVSSLMVCIILDSCGKERVDKCCLAQSRFASNLHSVKDSPQQATKASVPLS